MFKVLRPSQQYHQVPLVIALADKLDNSPLSPTDLMPSKYAAGAVASNNHPSPKTYPKMSPKTDVNEGLPRSKTWSYSL